MENVMIMKGVRKKGNNLLFRVCLGVYPENLVKKVFGEGTKKGNYIVFEGNFKETEVYEKFNRLLELMA